MAFVAYKQAGVIDDADCVLVKPEKFQGSMEIVKVERRTLVMHPRDFHQNFRCCLSTMI